MAPVQWYTTYHWLILCATQLKAFCCYCQEKGVLTEKFGHGGDAFITTGFDTGRKLLTASFNMKCCNLAAHNNIPRVNHVGKVWLNGVEEPCFATRSGNSYGTLFFTELPNNCRRLSIPLANNK